MSVKLQELILCKDAFGPIKPCRLFGQANRHAKEMRETKEQTVHKVSDNKKNEYSAVNEKTRN